MKQTQNKDKNSQTIRYDYLNTRWFKYDRDKLWLVYTQIVPVIFEPPCNNNVIKMLITLGLSVMFCLLKITNWICRSGVFRGWTIFEGRLTWNREKSRIFRVGTRRKWRGLKTPPPSISTKALITQITSFSAQEGESWEYFPGVKILRRKAEAPNIYVMPSLLRGAIPPLPLSTARLYV